MDFSHISIGESNRDITFDILVEKLEIPCPQRVLCRARSLRYPLYLFDNRLDRSDFPIEQFCVCMNFL